MQRGYCFRFAGRDLGYQRLPSPAAVLRATLKRKALYVNEGIQGNVSHKQVKDLYVLKMVKICTYTVYVNIFGKIWTIKLKSVKICSYTVYVNIFCKIWIINQI